MALFKCRECGNEREGRCKPRKCPDCGGAGTYDKVEEAQKEED